MESSSETMNKNDESAEPSDSVEKVGDKEADIQAAVQNESENVNIDAMQLIEATDNEMLPEKCDDEPMDIDEILNSLGADFDTPSSSEVQNVCDASSLVSAENRPELPTHEEERKGQEVVLLSDDDETAGKLNFSLFWRDSLQVEVTQKFIRFSENEPKPENVKDEPELTLEKGNEVEESSKAELETLSTKTEQEPVQSAENQFDALLSSSVTVDTTTEVPIVEKTQQSTDADDIVMLSDDELGENGK